MKFLLGIVIIVFVCLAGLLVYGQMLEPTVRTIEVEVTPDGTQR